MIFLHARMVLSNNDHWEEKKAFEMVVKILGKTKPYVCARSWAS